MANKKEAIEIVMVVDRSGSMDDIRKEAVSGFNKFLEAQKLVKGAANMTLVFFDSVVETMYESVKLKDVSELTDNSYIPGGLTAMNDGIGEALRLLEYKAPEKAILCILTDGMENASKEYTYGIIKNKIESAKERGWEVVFLAANIDAKQSASMLGVSANMAMGFSASAEGIHDAYDSMSNSTTVYRSS